MAVSARRAWIEAEKRCFAWLKEQIGEVSDAVAYRPEIPATFGSAADVKMWAFSINGPGPNEPLQVLQAGRPACTWNAGARLFGIFETRETALDVAGIVMDRLPIDQGELDGIVRLNYSEFPTVDRDTILLTQDQSQGGEKLIWKLDLSMLVWFSNVRN